MLASTFSRPRCAMPITASSSCCAGGRGEHRVQQRDQRLGALQREPPLADELGLQEHLERLGHVEPGQDADLLVMLGPAVRPLDPRLDPGALLRVLHVHVLDADSAAVGVAQHAEYLAQLHPRLAAETAGGELPLQVPERQAVLVDVQVGVLALLVLQRVGVGHEVAAHPVGVDQLVHPGGLGDGRPRGRPGCPAPSGPARTGSAAPGRPRRRSRPRRAAARWMIRRKSPDCAPWMIRWS